MRTYINLVSVSTSLFIHLVIHVTVDTSKTYVRTYIHTYMRTKIFAYICTYIHSCTSYIMFHGLLVLKHIMSYESTSFCTDRFNSIQFISCSVDPKGVVNPQDVEHVNI